jgi:hypothetical protein
MSLPEQDHVIRYLNPKSFMIGDTFGKGFIRRAGELGVSVNHFEHFNDIDIIKSLSRLKHAATGKFAKINIGETKAYIQSEMALVLDFISDPLPEKEGFQADPSHALILNFPFENSPNFAMLQMLLTDCVVETYPTRSL